MAYKHAKNKPEKDLINYTTVFGPDLLEVEAQIGAGTKPQTLLAKFEPDADSFSESHVENVVKFLHATDFIERPEDRVIEPLNQESIAGQTGVAVQFELRLLHHLRQQNHPQEHFTQIHDVALSNAEKTISRKQLATELNRELDFEFEWNEQKVRTWARLYSNLGVISQTNEEGIILSPSRGLLYKLLSLHSEISDSTDLKDALDWIEENFFSVYESRTGTPTVHISIAQVLENMENDETVNFRGMADASNEVRVPFSRAAGVENKILKSYSFESKRPKNGAYTLPMTQTDSKENMGETA